MMETWSILLELLKERREAIQSPRGKRKGGGTKGKNDASRAALSVHHRLCSLSALVPRFDLERRLVGDSSSGGDVWVVDWTTEIKVTFKIGVNLIISTLPM